MLIQKGDYIEGYEYFGHTVKKVKGWVDKVLNFGNHPQYVIQADDIWKGHRGTIICSELGEVIKLDNKERFTQ